MTSESSPLNLDLQNNNELRENDTPLTDGAATVHRGMVLARRGGKGDSGTNGKGPTVAVSWISADGSTVLGMNGHSGS